MLGMKKYARDYIDACRARVDADVRAYRKQVGNLTATLTPCVAVDPRYSCSPSESRSGMESRL
jgi:hypothetical protein